MAIFNSYVKVPEGNMGLSENRLPQEIHWFNIIFKHALFWGTSHFQTLASKQKMSQVTTPTILSATLTSGRVEEKCRRYHFWHSGRYAAFEALFDPTLLREH